jgi:RNA polymerase sigma-70 factor (ECF subfamily)
MKIPDEQLIERILQGERSAYALLVDRHRGMAYSIALRILNNREDAEEAAQDAFIKAFRALPEFGKRAKFSTWLYRIVYNTAVSRTRKKRMEFVAMDDAVIRNHAEPEQRGPEEALDREERANRVSRAVEKLPEADRLLVTLFYQGEKSVGEVSYITGLTESNVKVRLFRIRKRIQEEVMQEPAMMPA